MIFISNDILINEEKIIKVYARSPGICIVLENGELVKTETGTIYDFYDFLHRVDSSVV